MKSPFDKGSKVVGLEYKCCKLIEMAKDAECESESAEINGK